MAYLAGLLQGLEVMLVEILAWGLARRPPTMVALIIVYRGHSLEIMMLLTPGSGLRNSQGAFASPPCSSSQPERT